MGGRGGITYGVAGVVAVLSTIYVLIFYFLKQDFLPKKPYEVSKTRVVELFQYSLFVLI